MGKAQQEHVVFVATTRISTPLTTRSSAGHCASGIHCILPVKTKSKYGGSVQCSTETRLGIEIAMSTSTDSRPRYSQKQAITFDVDVHRIGKKIGSDHNTKGKRRTQKKTLALATLRILNPHDP